MSKENYIDKNISPVANQGQHYIWYARYYNGKIIYEFDNDGDETLFDNIDKSNVEEFGLLGNGTRIHFNTFDGILYRCDADGVEHSINVFLMNGNTKIEFTDSRKIDYHNIIEYKQASFDLVTNNSQKKSICHINGYYIGHKGVFLSSDFKKFSYQLIYNINNSTNVSAAIIVKINSMSEDMEPTIHLVYDSKDINGIIHLEKNKSNQSFAVGI
jgi:hypothetical protein